MRHLCHGPEEGSYLHKHQTRDQNTVKEGGEIGEVYVDILQQWEIERY